MRWTVSWTGVIPLVVLFTDGVCGLFVYLRVADGLMNGQKNMSEYSVLMSALTYVRRHSCKCSGVRCTGLCP